MHHRSPYKKAYTRQVKVLTSVEHFIVVLNSQKTVGQSIGIVFQCKHKLIHSYIQSLNQILKFEYLQIWHKACLSPFLDTNWPQRHNRFQENPLHHVRHDRSLRSKRPETSHEMEATVQIPHPVEDSDNQVPSSPGRQRFQCPGYARGGGGGEMLKLRLDRYIEPFETSRKINWVNLKKKKMYSTITSS